MVICKLTYKQKTNAAKKIKDKKKEDFIKQNLCIENRNTQFKLYEIQLTQKKRQ
jgi:hypothetical protein